MTLDAEDDGSVEHAFDELARCEREFAELDRFVRHRWLVSFSPKMTLARAKRDRETLFWHRECWWSRRRSRTPPARRS
jgi:hypothetical protein